ncbi:MAG TPA: phage tail tape measure C-terminal domain-containing protein [Acidobacteriota bacterium]|nr:phage tail tape measure C-terminal domain-containing protein [Acidobacteriota bacterium]
MIDLDRKVADLLEKAANLPTAAERKEAAGLVEQYKGVETTNAKVAIAEKEIEVLIRREKELEEIKKKDAAAGEADIHNRLAALDLAEAEGAYHRDTLLERQRLLRELLALQQNWLKSIDPQDRTAMNTQTAAMLRTQQQIAGYGVEMRPVFTELKKYAEDATDAWTQAGAAVGGVFKGMEDALVEFVKTGKLNFSDFAQSVILDLIRIQIRASITGPMAKGAGSFFGDIGGLLFGNFEFHSGGMGNEPTKYRIMPNPDMLPRYHKGLGPGERMSVTTDDEMILTPGQQKRMAELMGGTGGGAGGGPQSVRVEIVNQGQPVKATKAEGNFNGQEYVVTVFLDALNRNAYGLRNALAGG